jgi:hypothetical protein
MKTWKLVTTAILAIAAIALVTTSVYGLGMMGGGYGGYGGGMMGGYGYGYGTYTNPQVPAQTGTTGTTISPTYQAVYPYQFGGGCMGRFGANIYIGPATGTTGSGPLTINTAATVAQNYVTAIGNPDLVVKQVEEYANNFYVQVNEKSTGNGAFELLINKYTGSIYPEMGPNMMWNTKYGMMRGGILGGIFGAPTAAMNITPIQATTNAQTYLTTYLPGTTTGDATTFHGYYTIEIVNSSTGTTYGMLSVNGFTGQVWFHNWHGIFIQELTP